MNPLANAPWPIRAAALLVVALAVLCAIATQVVIVALLGLGKFSSDVDLVKVPAWLWYYRADPLVARWTRAGLIIAAGLLLLIVGAVAKSFRPPLHGKAHFASEAEIKAGGLRARKGIVLGRAHGGFLIFGGSEHVMLYAPTRTGKGVGVVIPNLLNWPDSVVVLDVKRENWEASAGFRAAHGQTVWLFDPLAPNGATARYNPLAHIERENSVSTLDELQRIATMLFPLPERGDPFWAEAARTGFIGVGAMVAETIELPFTLGEIYRQLTLGNPKVRLAGLITERAEASRPLSPGCVSALSDFCAAGDNTFASIRQTLTARMGLWLNPLVDEATRVSDFDLRQLRISRQSIYLCTTPENLARVAPLYNLLLQQLIDLSTRSLPIQGVQGPQILVLLDEFARLGHAGVIAHGFSFVAGYGLRFLAVLQSPSQLRAEYGPDLAEEIMTNCGVEVVFAPKDVKTAQSLSERLGYFGLPTVSKSRPLGFSSGKRTLSEADQRRALMLPQELLTLAPDALLVLRAGVAPIRGRKLVYYSDKAFAARQMAPPVVARHAAIQPIGQPSSASMADRAPRLRPMTWSEAAGVTPLTLDQIALSLEESGLEALCEDPTPEQVEAWAAAYIDKAALEGDLTN
jgi:type IV secretion system protein VirD4